jgi:hypothetical protein
MNGYPLNREEVSLLSVNFLKQLKDDSGHNWFVRR